MTRREAERERVLTAYLRARAAVEPPQSMYGEVLSRVSAEPQASSSPLGGWFRLLAVPVTAAAAVAVVLILQYALDQIGTSTPAPERDPTPTLSASPRATPTLEPTASPTASPGFEAGTFVRASGSQPGWYERDQRAEPVVHVRADEILYLVEGPVEDVDGVWYRVQSPRHRTAVGFVWLHFESPQAASAMLRPHDPRCPPVDDVESFSALAPMERLACYGSEPLTLDPVYVQEIAGEDPVSGDPAWLADNAPWEIYTTADWPNATTEGTLSGRLDPNADVSLSAGWWELRGHFDHPDAALCERELAHPAYTEPESHAVLWCRQQFVITDATPTASP